MKTATLIKEDVNDEAPGYQSLYKVSPPVEYDKPWDDKKVSKAKTTEYIVVSAANVMMSGPETYIFPSNEKGEVIDWTELDGSYRGGLDHHEALTNAGYEVL